MILTLLFALAACSGSDSKTYTTEVTSSKPESEKADIPKTDKIDVDLTAMSSTMIYSEVLNMTQTPADYLGKTVRMKGTFSAAEVNGQRYFACLIKDATACCSQGIEFVWAGEHSYPSDYPEENAEITVTGTFTTYMEGTAQYLQLKDADLQF